MLASFVFVKAVKELKKVGRKERKRRYEIPFELQLYYLVSYGSSVAGGEKEVSSRREGGLSNPSAHC